VTLKNHVLVWDGVRIGDDAFVGPGVIFTNDAAPRSPRMPQAAASYRDPAGWRFTTTVGQGSSLGAGAVVLPGLDIGAPEAPPMGARLSPFCQRAATCCKLFGR
jgi:UDP-2-acetamido-3-amino-2,3-dideoxy-glucuronate N-acetyltransferase